MTSHKITRKGKRQGYLLGMWREREAPCLLMIFMAYRLSCSILCELFVISRMPLSPLHVVHIAILAVWGSTAAVILLRRSYIIKLTS